MSARPLLVALAVVAACTARSQPSAIVAPVIQPFEADSVDDSFRVRGRIVGRLTVTVDSVVVLVDSARFEPREGAEQMLAALNVGLAKTRTGNWTWEPESESRYAWIEQRFAPGRPLWVRNIRLAIPRAGRGPLTSRWLAFALVTGEPTGAVGAEAVAFTPLHSSRRVFAGMQLPLVSARASHPKPDQHIAQDAAPPPGCRSPHLGHSGEVQLALVLDTLGHVEPGSLEVVHASSPDLVPPARATLAHCRFGALRIDGRAVRFKTVTTMRFR